MENLKSVSANTIVNGEIRKYCTVVLQGLAAVPSGAASCHEGSFKVILLSNTYLVRFCVDKQSVNHITEHLS